MPLSRGPSPPLPLLLLLAFLAGRGAGSSSHSLRYFVTSVSEPGQKEPQFFYVGYVDSQQFVSYDNITRRSVPKVPWITKVDKLDPHYWEQESRIFQNEEHIFRVSLGNLAGYYNQSREEPEVKVTRKADYDGMETLICRVGGFYPKDIDIDWTKDGEVWLQDVFYGLVSPNSDGTYYTWRSVTVDPKERERYKCHVEHDGLLNPVDVAWEEPASNLGLIIGCVVGILFLIAVMAGIVWIAVYFKKHHDGYKEPAASEQGSNSSGRGTAVPI